VGDVSGPSDHASRAIYDPDTTDLARAGLGDGPRRVLDDRGVIVGEYDRNYSMLRTFEPFRQRDRD